MKIERFNDSECVESPTSFGTLKTRALYITFDALGPDANRPIYEIAELCRDYGFDNSYMDINYDYGARRLSIYQKWWDRSERLQK